MRSTSIFLLITSVLTFSFSAFTASAEDAAMHHHTMSSMADMPEMKKADDSATLYSASGVIKAWRDDAVVIAHSPVTELNWPAMTMSFALADNHDKSWRWERRSISPSARPTPATRSFQLPRDNSGVIMHIFNKAACGLPLLLSLMSTNGWATTLAEALSAAENYSAELSANDHQVNALKNMADSAMQLPDPKLKFGIENVPLGGNNAGRLTREGMTMQRVGVMQDYVSSTKRERKADSITAEARQTAANADVIRARLQRETAQAWLALALAQKSLRSVQTLISETSRQIDVQRPASAAPAPVPAACWTFSWR